MPTILLASDLTERSGRAAARAVALAAEAGAALVAVTALPAGSPPEEVAAAEAALTARIAALPGAAAIDFRAEAYLGAPEEVVAAAGKETGAGLLVLGLHRPRALDALTLTTMEALLLAAPVPVLLAHRPVEGPYARILLATAFTPACAAAAAAAAALAPAAAMQAVHALDLSLPERLLVGREAALAEAEAACSAWCATPGLPPALPRPMIVPGNPLEVLELARESFAADLLALGAGRVRGRLGHWVRDLIREPPVDVLVAPPPE